MPTDATAAAVRPELVLQLGHNGDVRSVVFTTDGRGLISGGWDFTVRIWHRAAPDQDPAAPLGWSLLHRLEPDGVVNAVALSPDGRTIACGSAGVTDGREHGRVILWDARTVELLRCLDGHDDQVRSLCFSPDGATLAGGSWDGSVILWDTRTWTSRHTLQGDGRVIDSLDFSCDSRLIAAPQNPDSVLVWDARTGDLHRRLTIDGVSPGCIDAVAFSPAGPLLAVGTGRGDVYLWDTREWRVRRNLKGCRCRVNTIAFAPDGQTVAATDLDSVLWLWDVPGGRKRWRRSVHPREERQTSGDAASAEALAFSPDGTVVAVGTGLFEDSIRFFDARTGDRLGILPGQSDPISIVRFSPDGGTLAMGGMSDDTLRCWDTRTGELTRTVKRGRDAAWLAGYSPDGAEILTHGAAGRRGVQRWDARTTSWIGSLTGPRLHVCAVAFSPEGSVVAVGGCIREEGELVGRLQIRDPRTGALLRSFRGVRDEVLALAFSPDGRLLASGSGDWCKSGEARVWGVATGRCLLTLTGHPNQVESLAFSPDGRLLAAASDGPIGQDGPRYASDVRLWDVETGALFRTLPDAEHATEPIAFSPDGCLATCAEGTKVKLWNPETGALLRTLAGHAQGVLDLAFSPDGRRLATTSLDCTVKLWDPRNGALLATFVILPPEHLGSVATEWITFTTLGHYICSSGAARFIRWRIGDELYLAEQFESEYLSAAAVVRTLWAGHESYAEAAPHRVSRED